MEEKTLTQINRDNYILNILSNSMNRILMIDDIPSTVSKNHNTVFYDWANSGLENAILIHVDAHSDMNPAFSTILSKEQIFNTHLRKFTNSLNIQNFISPAIAYGIVSDVFWINPYSSSLFTQDMGSVDYYLKRPMIKVSVSKQNNLHVFNIERTDEYGKSLDSKTGKDIHEISLSNIQQKPLILDIDLDAFCCNRVVDNNYGEYLDLKDYPLRINSVKKILEKIRKPNLITITRSEGITEYDGHKNYSYVPTKYVDTVQKETILMLKQLYE